MGREEVAHGGGGLTLSCGHTWFFVKELSNMVNQEMRELDSKITHSTTLECISIPLCPRFPIFQVEEFFYTNGSQTLVGTKYPG